MSLFYLQPFNNLTFLFMQSQNTLACATKLFVDLSNLTISLFLLYNSAILILFQFFQNTSFILDLYNHVFSLLEILAHVQFLFGLLILIFCVSNQNLLFQKSLSCTSKFWLGDSMLLYKHELLLIVAFIMLYFKCVITFLPPSFRTETKSVCFPSYP